MADTPVSSHKVEDNNVCNNDVDGKQKEPERIMLVNIEPGFDLVESKIIPANGSQLRNPSTDVFVVICMENQRTNHWSASEIFKIAQSSKFYMIK
uniref:Uncharacterized protein n=1 Tax=Glossina brevipalpis TaxID=37001 RepID=A0A1A9WGM5_9MUSC